MASGDQREGVRVAYRNGSHLMGKGLQVTLPGLGELGVEVFFHPSQHLGDDGLEEVLTAGHVPVQRHRLDAQSAAQRPHRQLLSTLRIDVGQGRTHDEISTQSCPAWRL